MPKTLPPPPDRGLFRRWGIAALDLLYPPVCALCEQPLTENRSLCPPCNDSLPRLREPFCSVCGEHFEGRIDGDFHCPNCSNLKFAFDFARPAMLRDERTLQMIHGLKYQRAIHLAHELGRLASESLSDPRFQIALQEKWPLVPVPLHRSRYQWRHFNQAEEIALQLSQLIGLPVLHALKRVRKTATQTRLSRKERLENLSSAFARTRQKFAETRGAILIDDVFTTGSTVDACAKTLRKAGFQNVAVITVMRG
ncbi:ComF family protein [Luteolibacter pohnpeiensis]|uniref:ComF family protein n=1 Tax=Luteolibacter pohnpeiensis TaxID=454153 RepID=A0A934S8F7_9BACT|nr:ComF family protein [Luteolibacter pohnpeiensis]MBK1883154.1 ComF family protein [Luteolibacter pohnpeiensis]